jgi:hypothetical protein
MEAEKQFAIGLALCPHHVRSLMGMGSLHYTRESTEAHPDHVGFAAIGQERWEMLQRSSSYLASALSFDSDNAAAHLAHGHVLKEQGFAEEASHAYLRTLELERATAPRPWAAVPLV